MKKASKASILPWLIGILMTVYVFLDSLSVRAVTYAQIAYITIILFIIFSIIFQTIALQRRFVTKNTYKTILFYISISVIYLCVAIITGMFNLRYTSGDFVIFLAPFTFFLLSSLQNFYDEERLYLFLFFSFTLASLFGYLFGDLVNNRFDPPKIIVFSIGWYFFFHTKKTYLKVLILPVMVLLLLLSFYSGQRSSFLIWFIALIIFYYLFKRKNIIFILLLIVIFAIVFQDDILHQIELSRFRSYLNNQQDSSIESRYQEFNDVIRMFNKHGNVFNQFFGFGHGATFEQFNLISDKTLTSDQNIHHIHNSAVMIYFRYGFFGLSIYFYLVYRVIFYLFIIIKKKYIGIYCIFLISALLYLIDSMFRNIFADPIFSFTLGGIIYLLHNSHLVRTPSNEPT